MFDIKLFVCSFLFKYHLELIYVLIEILLQFICSFELLGFLLMKIQINEINKKSFKDFITFAIGK